MIIVQERNFTDTGNKLQGWERINHSPDVSMHVF